MNDDVIRGILIEKKRRARRNERIGKALLLIGYTAFGLYVALAIAAS